jgi:hypothetical protein
MARTLQEVQNENRAITKQLSKCVINESVVSKNFEELNVRHIRLLAENETMKENILVNKMMDMIPKMQSTLEICKNTDKEYQVCKQEFYQCSLENSKMKRYVEEELVPKYNKEECKDSCYPADFQKYIDDSLPENDAYHVYE